MLNKTETVIKIVHLIWNIFKIIFNITELKEECTASKGVLSGSMLIYNYLTSGRKYRKQKWFFLDHSCLHL